jgi:importin-7
VWLKNRVHTNYSTDSTTPRRPDSQPVANSDRDALRTHILPLLAASPSRSITVQLAHTLKNIVAHDFPTRWPELLPALRAMLTSTNIREVHAGCVGVLEAIRAFRLVA